MYGLPLSLYVDYHSFFFTHTPEAHTQLGAALRFYGVSFRYASTPQAKGKIERGHQWKCESMMCMECCPDPWLSLVAFFWRR